MTEAFSSFIKCFGSTDFEDKIQLSVLGILGGVLFLVYTSILIGSFVGGVIANGIMLSRLNQLDSEIFVGPTSGPDVDLQHISDNFDQIDRSRKSLKIIGTIIQTILWLAVSIRTGLIGSLEEPILTGIQIILAGTSIGLYILQLVNVNGVIQNVPSNANLTEEDIQQIQDGVLISALNKARIVSGLDIFMIGVSLALLGFAFFI